MNDVQPSGGTDEPSAKKKFRDQQLWAKKLELENKTLRAVLDSMPDNISIKDLEGRYIFDNNSHCRFLGAKDTSEVVGKTLFDFFPTEIAEKFHAEDLQVLRSGKPIVRCVDEAVDSAGNRVWMSVTKMPLYDDEGQLLGLVSTT
ncbi:MAG TPA: PAS domain-containing protein, partial [Terrimicrobiaceae bacterium]